jgi:hypothetical protein
MSFTPAIPALYGGDAEFYETEMRIRSVNLSDVAAAVGCRRASGGRRRGAAAAPLSAREDCRGAHGGPARRRRQGADQRALTGAPRRPARRQTPRQKTRRTTHGTIKGPVRETAVRSSLSKPFRPRAFRRTRVRLLKRQGSAAVTASRGPRLDRVSAEWQPAVFVMGSRFCPEDGGKEVSMKFEFPLMRAGLSVPA